MHRILVLAVLSWLRPALQAQDAWPTKPISMVVAFPPGGVADIVGRPLAVAMEKTLKQPVLVINRPGAGGATGTASVAKAAPDGYTILMALSSISIFPVSDRINGKQPTYEMKEFAPIALVTADPTVLVVRADGPYKTLKEFRRRGEGESRQDQLLVLGRLRHAARGDGNLRQRGGHQAVPRALRRRRAGGDGAARRPGRGARLRARPRPSARSRAARCARSRAGARSASNCCRTSRPSRSSATTPSSTSGPAWSRPPPRRRRSSRSCARRCAKPPIRPNSSRPMAKVETPIAYLDAPEFQKYWDADAKRLAVALEKIGKVEESK